MLSPTFGYQNMNFPMTDRQCIDVYYVAILLSIYHRKYFRFFFSRLSRAMLISCADPHTYSHTNGK